MPARRRGRRGIGPPTRGKLTLVRSAEFTQRPDLRRVERKNGITTIKADPRRRKLVALAANLGIGEYHAIKLAKWVVDCIEHNGTVNEMQLIERFGGNVRKELLYRFFEGLRITLAEFEHKGTRRD